MSRGQLGRRLLGRAQDFVFPATCGLEAVALESILGGYPSFDVQFEDWDKDRRAGTLWDLFAISAITRVTAPLASFEIGTGRGRSTLQIAVNTPPEATVFTLDLGEEPNVGVIFVERAERAKIQKLTGNSMTFDYQPWEGRIDLVLVDGGHDEATVASDTVTAFKLLAPGGRIIWDDFCPGWPGVVRAIKSSTKRGAIRRIVGTKLAYYRDE